MAPFKASVAFWRRPIIRYRYARFARAPLVKRVIELKRFKNKIKWDNVRVHVKQRH